MEKRKVQKTGGSTYIVSLPKDWAKGRVKAGDEVFIDFEGDSVLISPSKEQKQQKRVVLDYEEPVDALLRRIIARYLVGYDLIVIKSETVIENKEEIESLVREKMMGLEVTGETAKEIRLQNLLNYSDLPTRQTVARMDSIIGAMYQDVVQSLANGSDEILRDVIKRENEIDRLYLLAVRQIKGAIRDRSTRKKLGIDSELLCLGYRIIVKSMERIADHLKKISTTMLRAEVDIKDKKDLEELGNKSLQSYTQVMESLFTYDGELAENAIAESKHVKKLSQQLSDANKDSESYLDVKDIISSLDRTRELARDIAEIVINLSAGELD